MTIMLCKTHGRHIPESDRLVIRPRCQRFRIGTPRNCGDAREMALERVQVLARSSVPYPDRRVSR